MFFNACSNFNKAHAPQAHITDQFFRAHCWEAGPWEEFECGESTALRKWLTEFTLSKGRVNTLKLGSYDTRPSLKHFYPSAIYPSPFCSRPAGTVPLNLQDYEIKQVYFLKVSLSCSSKRKETKIMNLKILVLSKSPWWSDHFHFYDLSLWYSQVRNSEPSQCRKHLLASPSEQGHPKIPTALQIGASLPLALYFIQTHYQGAAKDLPALFLEVWSLKVFSTLR